MNKYEINKNTIAIIPLSKNKSRVIEDDKSFDVFENSMDIIKNGCKYFGSSYSGRLSGTKNLIGISVKAPIVIEESSKIIFFPTSSPRLIGCIWINLVKIDTYNKIKEKATIILFNNGNRLKLNVSYNIIDNQVLRATRLESVLDKRIRELKF